MKLLRRRLWLCKYKAKIWFTQNIVVLSKGSCYRPGCSSWHLIRSYQWNNVQSDHLCRWLDPACQLLCTDAKAALHQFGSPRIGRKHPQVQCTWGCTKQQLRSEKFSFVNTCVSLTIDGTTLPVVNAESKSPYLKVQPDWKGTTQTPLCLLQKLDRCYWSSAKTDTLKIFLFPWLQFSLTSGR